MLEFDIELAKLALATGSGRIVTKLGQEVRITEWDRNDVFPITGEIKGEDDNFSDTISSGLEASWTKTGKYWQEGISNYDLFIEELC